ncbi:hypothetical protein BIY22_16025 [Vibrio panuliri]|uniref:Uncharacterized protein n=1 Tax=Vibrio panuliri TaxID=1381081 RepID=A0A1Q9HNF4_9VIBR|nr:hypothetical protein [Vibrio panuliri]OLQ92320.1 hypothetical protein BIY22_16025 [Vibrio panuliri]
MKNLTIKNGRMFEQEQIIECIEMFRDDFEVVFNCTDESCSMLFNVSVLDIYGNEQIVKEEIVKAYDSGHYINGHMYLD